MLNKEVSSTIFWVFGMTCPGIELRSPGPLANTLLTKPQISYWNTYLEKITQIFDLATISQNKYL